MDARMRTRAVARVSKGAGASGSGVRRTEGAAELGASVHTSEEELTTGVQSVEGTPLAGTSGGTAGDPTPAESREQLARMNRAQMREFLQARE